MRGAPVRTAAKQVSPHHRPRLLSDTERAVFRAISQRSAQAKLAAQRGEIQPVHDVNVPKLDSNDLMPLLPDNGLRALSLFSGGGGLDLGFARAGWEHVASWDVLSCAGDTLRANRPTWEVHSGPDDGDVTKVNWRDWRGAADVIHGGPPCQPFSVAGRQRGSEDSRDMFPEFVRAVRGVQPAAFVAENVAAVGGPKFRPYLTETVLDPLGKDYEVFEMVLQAERFGVPQKRRRFILIGFRRKRDAERWVRPAGHFQPFVPELFDDGRETAMGVREALGLPDIGYDALSPTIRSSLTGPRHTTSILNSVSARRVWEKLEVWPNGVAADRQQARAFVPDNRHFRLSVQDVAMIQGFPEDWPLAGAVYMALGQIGNAVPPPIGYAVGASVAAAIV
jgi:DNA (cytosine-5)-methyltransferase 1